MRLCYNTDTASCAEKCAPEELRRDIICGDIPLVEVTGFEQVTKSEFSSKHRHISKLV